jgi:hypothetical protein
VGELWDTYGMGSKRTFFISGHRDITESEFNEHYVTKLNTLIKHIPYCELEFVVGDYFGVDEMAQDYLAGRASVVVYHMFDTPRTNKHIHRTVGGFYDDESRDTAMTKISEDDVAWVRPGREGSGTHQNVLRRQTYRTDAKPFILTGEVNYNYATTIKAANLDEAKKILLTRLEQGGVTLTLNDFNEHKED